MRRKTFKKNIDYFNFINKMKNIINIIEVKINGKITLLYDNKEEKWKKQKHI